MSGWKNQKVLLPGGIHQFDWRTFQLEYRDFFDITKLASTYTWL
ncbi:EcsC family protein [Fulvivirga marina]|nr:EcsC family protein [Fulvivirga marina]